MDLSGQERDELRTTARTLLDASCTSTQVREVVVGEPAFDTDLWHRMVGLGWHAIHVDERHGGGGCGYSALAVILRELGRALTPSPFLASAVLATAALVAADNKALCAPKLAALVEGSALGSVAFASTDGTYELERLTTAWRNSGGDLVLDGVSGFVLDADVADFLVVAASSPEGLPGIVLVETTAPGLVRERRPTVDLTRRLFEVTFDGVTVSSSQLLSPTGEASANLLDRVLAAGVVAAATDAVGVAERALELSSRYAREREQFGKPIGSFQAVKHLCADMAINVEASKAASNAAAAELDDDLTAWRTTAGITASYVGPACSEVCSLAMRVHGGIGFTWEHDTHLLMKRAMLDELLFGRPSWHRQRLADEVFPTLLKA